MAPAGERSVPDLLPLDGVDAEDVEIVDHH
jgi:hypothetical protein